MVYLRSTAAAAVGLLGAMDPIETRGTMTAANIVSKE
jgi:hypothetical protein